MSDLQVTVYKDSNFGGTNATLGIGRYASGVGIGNDSISSLRIPDGLRVILFENENFGGRACILVRDTPDLGNANDATGSMIIEPLGEAKVIVYTDSYFRGWSAEVPVGSQAKIGAGVDVVSSVLIPPGLKVLLFENENFGGRACILVFHTPDLGNANDAASSIIVEPLGDPKVIVYSDSNFRGWSAEVPVGSQAKIGAGADLVSSVIIPLGLKVRLFENENFGGRACILVRHTPDLGNANDAASSIIVEPIGDPKVIVYTDSNFRGWSAEVPIGSQAKIGAGADIVSSVLVPPGLRVTLYKNPDFGGDARELNSDAAELGSFNDATSSIIVDRRSNRAPSLDELKQLIGRIGPRIYFQSDDSYGPSSVEWFLQRASLCSSSGTARRADDGPLPKDGSDDGAYWLVGDSNARSGDLGTAVGYVNAKLRNGWLDVQFWIFYPYNGAGRAYVRIFGANSLSKTVNLVPMGEHGGDWEHVTCRVYPETLELRAMYLAQHDSGEWVSMGDIPKEDGHPVVYSSRNGHASYRGTGRNLSNGDSQSLAGQKLWEIGLLNETDKSSKRLDCHSNYQIVRTTFLTSGITTPQWLEYCRRWGPHITYDSNDLKDGIRSQLSGIPYSGDITDAIWKKIPDEAKEENGPTGPWRKGSWDGDE